MPGEDKKKLASPNPWSVVLKSNRGRLKNGSPDLAKESKKIKRKKTSCWETPPIRRLKSPAALRRDTASNLEMEKGDQGRVG